MNRFARISKRGIVGIFASVFLTGSACAQTYGTFGNFSYLEFTTEVTITRFPSYLGGSVTVPSTINGKSVTEIGQGAFDRCQYVSSITLPSSIRKLSVAAFQDCSGLSSFTIPSGATSIQGNVFSGCSKLASITPISPPSGPTHWLFQGPPAESKVLAAGPVPNGR